MSYTPNGLFNHTAAIYQMMTGYPPDRVSPSGQLEPPSPPTSRPPAATSRKLKPPKEPCCRSSSCRARCRNRTSSARAAPPDSSARRTIRTACIRTRPRPVKTRRSVAAQGDSARAPEGPLRAAQGINGSMPDLEKAVERVRRRRVLRQGLRPRPLRQSARRLRSHQGDRQDCASATACTPSARACCCRAA